MGFVSRGMLFSLQFFSFLVDHFRGRSPAESGYHTGTKPALCAVKGYGLPGIADFNNGGVLVFPGDFGHFQRYFFFGTTAGALVDVPWFAGVRGKFVTAGFAGHTLPYTIE